MEMTPISILNNQGVDLLRRGNLKQAADTLQSAIDLAMSRSSMHCSTSASNTREENTSTADENIHQISARFTTAAGQPYRLPLGLLGSGDLDNAPSLFPSSNQFGSDWLYVQNQGLYLTSETLQGAMDRKFIGEAIVNSFLLYNLGLVLQLQSICGVGLCTYKEEDIMDTTCDSLQDRRYHAFKSRFLYLKCRLMLDLAGVARYQATGIPLLDLLSMSLYNNSAYAAFADGQYESCSNFSLANESYIYSVMTLPGFFQGDPETVSVISRYMANFLLNSFVLNRKPNVAAAA